ncbi:MAG: hypothetical protein QW039_02475 [Fervidicoccaceae archaeon]
MPKQKKEEKGQTGRSAIQQAEMNVSAPTELIRRAEREVKGMEYITPFSLAQKLGVSLSTSKKILKALEQNKLIEAVNRNRRSPIYISKKNEQ